MMLKIKKLVIAIIFVLLFSILGYAEVTYPIVANTNQGNDASGTEHTVNLPANIVAGNLLLVFFYSDDPADNDNIAGWTLLQYDSYLGHSCGIFYKVATGSEGGTVIATTDSNEASAHISLRITNWDESPEQSYAHGDNTSPDPPSLTPSWGSYKNLWIAVAGGDGGNVDVSSYPSGYSNELYEENDAPSGCWVAMAYKTAEAATENPGAFTTTVAQDWTAFTIAIAGETSGEKKNVLFKFTDF